MKSDNKIGNLLRNADVLAACGALVLLVGVTFFGVIMRYCLGDPFVLPCQLANQTRVHLTPPEFFTLFHAEPCAYAVLAAISNCYPPV